ncbi:hypothetical protein [Nonomuraea aridisoli]|uniref:DUF4238 domain-containing protein n=1 Tax=Nonomuraea aridisoli TaxID=2070368 RepID=A0A2W2EVQ8_9ACTN|nr:hypothetical protein [Nonomuraea aridisoli]PZG17650.1 hypothetical protein C1J01_17430 [Nonomuraea aridisoli]
MTTDSVDLLLAKYDTLEEQAVARYGEDSQARVFVLYEQLISLRAVHSADRTDARLSERITRLRTDMAGRYLASGPDRPLELPRRVLSRRPPLLEYDRDVFDRLYREASATVVAQTVAISDPVSALDHLTPKVSYMYVVDDEERLLVWTRPFELSELVFGRRRARIQGVPVAHPMLVPQRLRVRAAGEIVLIGEQSVSMVVANTKSGHFQPPPESADVVREACRRLFGLDDADIDVFNLFPDPNTQPR